MFPSTIPIFPLPNVVLFPNVFLPLHIFEPRYRQMVTDAIAGDRMIGMVLLKPGFGPEDEGRTPIFRTGCSGLITHVERLEDGRYNLVLRGIDKFTVHGEEDPGIDRLYRRAVITTIDETLAAADREVLRMERRRLETFLTPFFEGALAEHRLPATMPDEDLINALAQYLEFEPLEKLALLERGGPLARCRSMVELLEMKALLKKTSGDPGMIH
jgi:Lon protease-like protein